VFERVHRLGLALGSRHHQYRLRPQQPGAGALLQRPRQHSLKLWTYLIHLTAGLEKTRVKKKTQPCGVFGVFCVFLGFAQKREFLGFFQFREYF
jgi:hypothetical protein